MSNHSIDPIRISPHDARKIMKRLGAPLQHPKFFLKVLLFSLVSCLIIIALFVAAVIWHLSRPTSMRSLPQEFTQVRLEYSGHPTGAPRKLSEELLIDEKDSEKIISVANTLLARKAWYTTTPGDGDCTLRINFSGTAHRAKASFRLMYDDNKVSIIYRKQVLELKGDDAAAMISALNHPELIKLRLQACSGAR